MYQPMMPQLHVVAPASVAQRWAETKPARGAHRPDPSLRPTLTLLHGGASSAARADGPGRLIRFPDRTPPSPEAA